MRCLVVFVFLLLSVFSSTVVSGLTASVYKQLQELQKLSDKLDGEGEYSILEQKLKINIDELSLHVYTQSDPDGTQVSFSNANKITELSSFSTDLKTLIYIHGWRESFDKKGSLIVREALLNASNLNIVLMDWDKCAHSLDYVISWGCVEGAGNYLGEILTIIRDTYDYSLDNVTLVGHSLGAHIAGYAGKQTNGTLSAIVGLDPAKPLFFKDQKNHRLNEDDAQYVQAIHTCASVLGVRYNVGKVDFWPNGGYNQAGCGLNIICSHSRAYHYYAESIVMNDFVASKCDSYDDFKDGKCDNNVKGKMGGLNLDKSIRGNYFLQTNEKSPYGRAVLYV